jgi:hypothetical protein
MEALVIEEPPAPPPPEPVTTPTPPATVAAVQAPKKGHTRPKTDSHDAEGEAEPADSAAPASPSEVPSLEPQPNPGRAEETPSQLQARQDEIKRRITQLQKNSDLSTAEQRTLTDANSFWLQSVTAFQEHDLLKARELAQKASLLLAALEKR